MQKKVNICQVHFGGDFISLAPNVLKIIKLGFVVTIDHIPQLLYQLTDSVGILPDLPPGVLPQLVAGLAEVQLELYLAPDRHFIVIYFFSLSKKTHTLFNEQNRGPCCCYSSRPSHGYCTKTQATDCFQPWTK